MKKGLYFIAILPPDDIWQKVQDIKKEFVQKYDSKEAYSKPPHFTLQVPFKTPEKFEEVLIPKLTGFAKTQPSFEVQLSGFNHFRDDVIFIDIEDPAKMKSLHKDLIGFLQEELSFTNKMIRHKSLTPHMTLAYRDLSAANFKKAWTEFSNRSFNYLFNVDSIFLMKHDYKQWQRHHEFEFS